VTIVVAYQGEPGAFSELAIVALLGREAAPLPCARFGDVVAAVESGRAELGLLPTDNSIAGPVTESVAAIDRSGLIVAGTTSLPIRLSLLALPEATLESLRSVESHPVALRQCKEFLGAHPRLVPRESYDTAGAAGEVAASGDLTRAAIASSRAGELHGLVALATGLEDRSDNVTRFAIIARSASPRLLSALDERGTPANLGR
jgi:prephenate dehydratase